MAKTEKAIFTNLCMITDADGKLLVLSRKDPDWPGLCFPGGHVEPGEAFTDSVVREVFEETGLTIEAPRLCGVKQFRTDDRERYVVFLYRADRFTGELRSSHEGEVFWVPRADLPKYPLVPDFLDLLRVFEEPELNEFLYRKTENGWNLQLL